MTTCKCLNCNSDLEFDYDYCPSCGARQVKVRLRTKEVFKELLEFLLIWNNNFFKTFFSLLIHPSKVIQFYITGGRNRYMNPIFYLLLGFFLIQLINSISGQEFFLFSGLRGAVDGFNEELKPGSDNLDVNAINRLIRYSKILFFLMLPLIALCSKMVYKSSHLNYAEHLSVNAYMLGQLLILGLLKYPVNFLFDNNEAVVQILYFSLIPIYLTASFSQIFKNKAYLGILKSVLFMFTCLLVSGFFYVILVIILVSLIT